MTLDARAGWWLPERMPENTRYSDTHGSVTQATVYTMPQPQPQPAATPTVAHFLKALQVVLAREASDRGIVKPSPEEYRAIEVALREAADRRIEAEVRKLERVTRGAVLARKLVAAGRAARDAWRAAR